MCHSEGQWANLSAFELGMVVGARRTGLCQEQQRCWVFHAQQFHLCIKNDPLPKGHPANLTQLWETLESFFIDLTFILPGKLTENTFSFTAMTRGIAT